VEDSRDAKATRDADDTENMRDAGDAKNAGTLVLRRARLA
jgi:hypothetical protein